MFTFLFNYAQADGIELKTFISVLIFLSSKYFFGVFMSENAIGNVSEHTENERHFCVLNQWNFPLV